MSVYELRPPMNWLLDLTRHQTTKSNIPVFGVILYTDSSAHVKKALRDDDYWRALDRSSENWTIFSVRTRQGKWGTPSIPPDSMAMMIPVWREPEANLELLDVFGLDSTKGLPALVVFGVFGEELRHTSIPIDDQNEEAAYNSLKAGIQVVNQAIDSSIRRNVAGVFDELEKSLQTERSKKKAVAAYRALKELRDWLPF